MGRLHVSVSVINRPQRDGDLLFVARIAVEHLFKKLGENMNSSDYEYTLDCIPSEDAKLVTIEIRSKTKRIGVREMIKVLANFLKQQIDENDIRFDSVEVSKNDVVKKVQ